jgi:hypothetical protein
MEFVGILKVPCVMVKFNSDLPELDNKSIAVILESMLKANITHV